MAIIWRTSSKKYKGKDAFFKVFSGGFSINRRFVNEKTFNPRYQPGGVDSPLEFDRPAIRNERLRRIMGEGVDNYEIYAQKVVNPTIAKKANPDLHKTWFISDKEMEKTPASHQVFFYAKNKETGDIEHIGGMPMKGKEGLKQLLDTDAFKKIGDNKFVKVDVKNVVERPWYYEQNFISADLALHGEAMTAAEVFGKGNLSKGFTNKIGRRSTTFLSWLKKNKKGVGMAAVGVLAGVYILGWLGRSHNSPNMKPPSPYPLNEEGQDSTSGTQPFLEGIRNPHSSYGVGSGMSTGGTAQQNHTAYSDFGSGRDARGQLSRNPAMDALNNSRKSGIRNQHAKRGLPYMGYSKRHVNGARCVNA